MLRTFCKTYTLTATPPRRALHLTSVVYQKKAGRHKPSIKHDKPLTYEESNKPDMIGVRKSFNSFNTSALVGGLRRSECATDDLFVRKFLHGTWSRLISSDVVIKRQANRIYLNFLVLRGISPHKIYFLIGYTEEILSYILKCIVKVEIQTIDDKAELIYKYI